MRNNIFFFVCMVLMSILSACNVNKSTGNEDLNNLPGGYSYSDGATNYPMLYKKAAQYLNSNNYVQAEEIYRDLIEKEPENSNGYIGLGASLIYQEKFDKAIAAYSHALELNANSTEALVGLGSTFSKIGDYQTALENYLKALDLNPNDINAHLGAAIAMQNLGFENDLIIQHLEKIIDIDPSSDVATRAENLMKELLSQEP